jgi:7-carboxy-7-deazaguanine synthase (Cx14CxxC type)
MTYSVKEMYYTLQGEGAQSGRPAVFLRFAGCNLWSGREAHRAAAICRFCDTDFVGVDGPGGGRFVSAAALAAAVRQKWPSNCSTGVRYVVCTGGEPLLQLDAAAIDALHAAEFEIGIETNGTIAAPEGIDWICVSPKAATNLVQRSGDELKLVYPQREEAAQPERFVSYEFTHRFLQPLDDEQRDVHTRRTIRYCLEHPQWKLSLQTHKLLGFP